jgi:hypothetical protein
MWHLLAVALAGFQANAVDADSESASIRVSPPALMRTWSDAESRRQARATLLRREGDRLWLRTEDGREVTTTMTALSSTDKTYVAARMPPEKLSDDSTLSSAQSKTKWQPRMPSLKEAMARLESNYDDKEHVVPAVLVYVKVSRDFVNDFIERRVSRQKPLTDCVLGTNIFGQSNTNGKLELLLRPSLGKLSGEVVFDGTVQSNSKGYNGPAIIFSKSDSQFRARKPVSISTSGVHSEPARASVNTNLTTTGIGSTLPRLRGRIATRVAQRRNAEQHGEAESITADHTARRIRNDLDLRIDSALARIGKFAAETFPLDDMQFENRKSELRLRSTNENLELGMMVVEGVGAESLRLRPPAVVGKPDLAIRINRALFDDETNAGLEQVQEVAELFVAKLKSSLSLKFAEREKGRGENDVVEWRLEPDWVVVDYSVTREDTSSRQASIGQSNR